MQPPKPLKPGALEHPKGIRRSRWNGDKRRPAESQGFMARRKAAGHTVTDGTAKPRNLKPSDRDVAGARPRVDPEPERPPLSDRQLKLLRRKG